MILPDFDEATHTYTWKGMVVPGVTSVLAPISNYDGIPEHILERKAKIGTYAHYATELYDKDDLVMETLDPAIEPYVQAWIKFRRDTGFVVELSEQKVFHRSFFYAGTLDRGGLLNSERSLLDIKCVAALGPQTGVQTAAYREAINSQLPKKKHYKRRYAVQLKPDGTYHLQPYNDDGDDFKMFTSLLNFYNWRLKHGYK